MNIVSARATKIEFAGILEEETEEFKQHLERVKIQYDQLKALKDRLLQNHAIIQIDLQRTVPDRPVRRYNQHIFS